MIQTIRGLHHVTAIAIDPQANIDFYTQVLGLRLVKDTVNFDDPSTYHFYYGDRSGNPGTILTFFPFVLAGHGRSGSGMVDTVTFAVPAKSLDGWMGRLAERGIDFDGPFTRFSRPMIEFRDPDGLRLEIAAVDGLERIDSAQTDRDVARSIGGFGGCLALEFAARNARRYGAVIGLSAGLIGPDGTSRTYSGSLQETPVFLGCSDVDPHIPLARVHESSRSLSNLGGAVEERVYPGMGHTINEDEIKRVHSLLTHQVSATPAGAEQIDPSVQQFKR